MGKQTLERKLEALEDLKSLPASQSTLEQWRKALRDRNGYFVSKAAALVAELGFEDLIPDLIAAFDRFLVDPVKTDSQCWAKNAIAKALKDLGHRDGEVYLRGISHIQMEPVWGGRQDSAAALRGTCAMALIDSNLDDLEILTHLGDLLADPEKPARIDAALAIAQLGRPEGVLPLRVKALAGDSEPEVIGQCFASLLSLGEPGTVEFIGRFLDRPDEGLCLEAAAAIAQARRRDALDAVMLFWRRRLGPGIRRAVVMSLGASPLPESAEFLLSILADDSGEVAASVVAALAASRFRAEVRDRAASLVAAKDEPRLQEIFEREFGQSD